MLTQIHIRDLATIEELQLHLHTGCTMITGETGAGKSIFIEAIELALGGRASANMVRAGKEKADISLCFDITHYPHLIDYLQKLDLYEGSPDCIIRRVITHDGRSRCYVNHTPATAQLVKELGELLFYVHGQHGQHVLLKTDTQREIVDRYAGHLSLLDEIKNLAEEWRNTTQEIKHLRDKTEERASRGEYLQFQLEELRTIDLKAQEWEALEAEHHRLTHAEDLIRHMEHAILQIANEDHHALLFFLKELNKTLDTIQSIEPKVKQWMHLVDSILIQTKDLLSEMQHYLEHAELDQEKLQQIETRVSQIFNVSRKHKVAPETLVAFKNQLEEELTSLQSSDEAILKLEENQREIAKKYDALTITLTLNRKKAAQQLAKEITATIRSLSLPHAEFHIELEDASSADLSPHGREKIIFLIKTNPDQLMQPLAKSISGGELSRLSLAAHLALAHHTTIPILVFDEVDTGLSGATAEKIGKLLKKLGDAYQIFCITHQPQVAACSHHHLLVEKVFIEKTTHTRLRLLTLDEKTSEIARMLGGEKITEKTLAHAREVLQSIDVF